AVLRTGPVVVSKFDLNGNRLWSINGGDTGISRMLLLALTVNAAEEIVLHGRNDSGRFIFRFVQNMAPGLPIIHKVSDSQRLAVGQTVTLESVATGPGPLAFQWRLNNLPLASATNTTLTLANIQTNQAGAYSVLVTNSLGCAVSEDVPITITP